MYANKKGKLDCFSDKKVPLYMSDVLYVPNLCCNLLSIRKLASKEVYEMEVTVKKHILLANSKENSLWQRRFGHLNMKNVVKLQDSEMVVGMKNVSEKNDFCDVCMQAKFCRLPFNGHNNSTS